ncbi:hypothetical protein B0J13DRAFT_654601 [Dactylonectria estremocensis]|uniref:Endothelin-converting enzyme 1 n=1 Tax=Dactylonectria estremocensis TaxID=1079267 RepID=A0A9P9F7K7_9HYPO|nr:hypothetical protein B0J13DRAFT_654601 [Dactylonectria estremocensis]
MYSQLPTMLVKSLVWVLPLFFRPVLALGASRESKKFTESTGSTDARKSFDQFMRSPYCLTVDCIALAEKLTLYVTKKTEEVDPCEDWDEYVCGEHGVKNNFAPTDDFPTLREWDQEVNLATMIPRQSNALLATYLVKGAPISIAKRPEYMNKTYYSRVQTYYESCMDYHYSEWAGLKPLQKIIDKIHAAFNKYDARVVHSKDSKPEPMVDTSTFVDAFDGALIQDASFAMSQYRIWSFAKLTPQQSLFNSSTMRISVVPYIGNGLPRRGLYDDVVIEETYTNLIARFLRQAYKEKWQEDDYLEFAKQVITLERQILDIAPHSQAWQRIKENTVQMSVDELSSLVPELRVGGVVSHQPGLREQHVDELEVMFPQYWKDLQGIIQRTSKNAIRAYMIWKAFVQTQEILKHKVVDDYRNLMGEIIGTKHSWRPGKNCLEQTFKHYGPIVSSLYVNTTWLIYNDIVAKPVFEELKRTYIKLIQDTPWMDPSTRGNAISKMRNMSIMHGYTKQNPDLTKWSEIEGFFEGAPTNLTKNDSWGWYHADDYFEMEAWYARKAWQKELHEPPNKFKWDVNALSMEPYYSQQLNTVVAPAGIMQYPLLDTKLPLYAVFAGFGTLIAQVMAHGIDAQGRMFARDGTLDSWMTSADIKRYDDRQKCFETKYSALNVTTGDGEVLSLDGKRVSDEVIADIYGHEVAFNAWKNYTGSNRDKRLPGWGFYSPEKMFWILRSMRYCTLEQPRVLAQKLSTSSRPPWRIGSSETLKNSRAWNEAFGCKPTKSERMCRVWGNERFYQLLGDDPTYSYKLAKKKETPVKADDKSKDGEGKRKEKQPDTVPEGQD